MDPSGVIIISFDDELVFYPGLRFSEDSDEQSRVLFNPEHLLRALDEPLEGTHCYPFRSPQVPA